MIRYDPHDWWNHFFDIKGSMLKEILGRVLTCVIWSAVVVFMERSTDESLTFPLTIHSIVGTALGLLLVFRTNSANDRFWEGRKLWGVIVNISRNLTRASLTMIPRRADEIIRWTIALVFSTMHGLRGEKTLGEGREQLSVEEADRVERSDHPALQCAARLSAVLRQARAENSISDYDFIYLDTYVQQLIDCLGGCERIRKTPLPFSYLVHLRRALVLYCTTLPFALVKDFGWLTVPTTFWVAYVFFGIEEIGVEIEEPFGRDPNDLPLEDICATIRRNLLALSKETPEPLETSIRWQQASADSHPAGQA